MTRIQLSRLLFLLSICLCMAFSDARAQAVSEFATIDSLKVGDTFNYSIVLDRAKQYNEINFPDSTHFGELFEIRSRRHFQLSSYKDSVSYELQFFGTVDTTLPPLPVQLIQQQDTTTVYTNPIVVPFNSVLAKNEQDLRPLKPIYDFAVAWWPYILGFLILLVAGYFLYKYYWEQQEEEEPKERKTFTPSPFVNPLKQLKTTIRQLEKSELESKEDFKEFYITLGDAIRRYYEDLHGVPALESTSRELLMMLKKRSIDQDLVSDTRSVLQEADMVKFANFTPTNKQAERALKKAHNFLYRAREVDGPLVDHLRRKHHTQMESKRKQFQNEQENEEEVTA